MFCKMKHQPVSHIRHQLGKLEMSSARKLEESDAVVRTYQ